ncbi:ABC transporter ATP-binding protein [Candidatus Dojkabacteria bacterium]|nr:ABC transporter ATP-binding protein [Candidatus Dojkabacteria bacterium]
MLSARNLTKTYTVGGERIHAVDDVNLDIAEGEIVAIMGSSGSGKSTLLHLLSGLDQPTSGEISVDGKSLSSMTDNESAAYRNQTIGFVFQFFFLQPYLNVRENVEIPLMFRKMITSERQEKAVNALNLVSIADRIKHLPKQLSGGQMQRVAIARALVNNPKIIFADEPTGNLDEKTGKEIMDVLENISKQNRTTVIIVTHNPKIASRAGRIFNMVDGKLL